MKDDSHIIKIKKYNLYDLEKIILGTQLLNTEKKFKHSTPKKRHLLAVNRNVEGKSRLIYSNTNQFQSERNVDYSNVPIMFGLVWRPSRIMAEIPLYVSDESVLGKKITDDYSKLPKSLTSKLDKGILRTSGTKPTDYSILMSVTEHEDDRAPEGRTGVLLYKGKPITIDVDGKDFIIEVKGVGCPDGNNARIEGMYRTDYFGQEREEIGGFDLDEGKREFANLEIQRKRKVPSFASGDSVRALALFPYETVKTNKLGETKRIRQAYLLRLAPTNIRSSFNSNPNFPKVEDREMLLTTSIGQHYAELAKLEETLLHSTIHPENMVWTGTKYALTDFADCRRLSDIEHPHDFLNQVLEKISEVPGLTKKGTNNFYTTITKELGVEWKPETGYKGFIDSIWAGYFAQKVYANQKGKTTRADVEIDGAKSVTKENIEEGKPPLRHLFVNSAKCFLEEEIDILEHIKTPEAITSLQIARERVAYLTTQLNDPKNINAKFRRNPNSFYKLFILPYMQK